MLVDLHTASCSSNAQTFGLKTTESARGSGFVFSTLLIILFSIISLGNFALASYWDSRFRFIWILAGSCQRVCSMFHMYVYFMHVSVDWDALVVEKIVCYGLLNLHAEAIVFVLRQRWLTFFTLNRVSIPVFTLFQKFCAYISTYWNSHQFFVSVLLPIICRKKKMLIVYSFPSQSFLHLGDNYLAKKIFIWVITIWLKKISIWVIII